ncbi:hypothetical protein C8J57DRAFT_1467922 [Mycena rebaudengoi]|nr:hypothetical protein C8J57DRAFT_1467922 [Mycena rebaudengoi]
MYEAGGFWGIQDEPNPWRGLAKPGRSTVFNGLLRLRGAGFDGIILFGPPGVDKTVIFSAEATSEHIKRPFYVIGGGGLGTKAADLDAALERVFDVATAWTAIVLIDKLTYSSATPWQPPSSATSSTTAASRVQAFDKAFLSRIHVTLHFRELSEPSKAQVWRAFLAKAGAAEVSAAHISLLAQRDVNGHQIKNAMSTHPPSPTRFGSDRCLLSTQVRTAHSLAVRSEERIGFALLMDAMDEFTEQFELIRVARFILLVSCESFALSLPLPE